MGEARRRLTIADLAPIERIPAALPPRRDPVKPPKPPTPPRAPGQKTEAQRAAAKRSHTKWRRKQIAGLRPQNDELLTELCRRCPVTFALRWPKPLAIGIHHAIQVDLSCARRRRHEAAR